MDISYNDLESVSFLSQSNECAAMLQNLETFICGHNHLKYISCNIAELLENIKEMKLDYCYVSRFPISILIHCRQLVSLDISHNTIEECYNNPNGSAFTHQNLSTLKMSHNKIQQFPFQLCSMLKRLRILDLSHNDINILSDDDFMSGIVISDSVNLSFNSIEYVALSFLEKLSGTKQLDLSKNKITKIVANVDEGKNASVSLNRINLSHNKLDRFPHCLLCFKQLTTLNLSHNVISSFPQFSIPTALLKDLDLSYNKISDITELLKTVTGSWSHCLRALRIANNSLNSVSADLGMLRNLEVLDLQNNLLTHIPNDIGRLSKLYQLSLVGNKLDIDSELLSGRTQEILNYFFSRLKKSEERLKLAVILIGEPSVWKTNLLKVLADQHNVEAVKCVYIECGVQIYSWSLATGKRCFQITLCDITLTKDSIFKHYPQLPVCDCALYILVSTKSSDEDVLNSLKAIHALSPHCPVIIADVISDKMADVKISSSITEDRRSENHPGFPVHVRHIRFDSDLPTDSDVHELVICISSIVDEYEVKGVPMFVNPVPKIYINLETILLEARHELEDFPVLSYSGLIDLIQNHQQLQLNVEDGEELLSAVQFLTKVGEIWHQDDPRDGLRNYFILNPMWLLDVFQKVFTAVRQRMENNIDCAHKYIVPTVLLNEVTEEILTSGTSQATNVSSSFLALFSPAILRLMQNRGLVFLINRHQYFVPSFQDYSPDMDFSDENFHERNSYRLLEMDYVPVNFWHHITSGILCIYNSSPDSSDVSLDVYCWKKGVSLFRDGDLVFLLKESDPTELTTVKTASASWKPVIEVCVNKKEQVNVIPVLMDHIHNTIEEWFPDLMEFDLRGQQRIVQYIPCVACIADGINTTVEKEACVHLFEFSELAKAAESGHSEGSDRKVIDAMVCPHHSHIQLSLTDMVPDILLKDFDHNLVLNSASIVLQTQPKYLLGEGGFGTVFRSRYEGKDVAIKLLRSGSSTSAYINLRTELNVLGKLSHPSIVLLVGYLLNSPTTQSSPLLAMELATGGCLTDFLQHLENISSSQALISFPRSMRLRVVHQILEGVEYMHQHNIVFRDLKPDNVLVMTMEKNNPVNVKLVDFGIALTIAPSGTVGGSGSPGYSAPEVVALKIKKNSLWSRIPYTNKCDIFSFGLLLYEVSVCRTPWFLQSCTVSATSVPPNVPDDAILKGVLPASLTAFDINLRWPHMQAMISSCLQRNSENRPTARQLLDLLHKPEICCFRNRIDIGKVGIATVSHETLPHHDSSDKLTPGKELNQQIRILTSHFPKTTQQSARSTFHNEYSSANSKREEDNLWSSVKSISVVAESIHVSEQKSYQIVADVTCLLTISRPTTDGSGIKVKGEETGNIDLAGTKNGKLLMLGDKKSTIQLSDLRNQIECLYFHNRTDADSLIVVGLSKGSIAFFTSQQIFKRQCDKPQYMLDLSQYFGSSAVRCLLSTSIRRLYACCARHIVSVNIQEKGLPVIRKTKLVPKTRFKNCLTVLENMAVCHGNIYATGQSSSHILHWNEESVFPDGDTDLSTFFRNDYLTSTDSIAVTSILADESRCVLYIGLSTGHIVLLTCESRMQTSLQLITIIHRHTGPVWKLSIIPGKQREQDLIVAIGHGFRSILEEYIWGNDKNHSDQVMSESSSDQSSVTFYDANISVIAEEMKASRKQRKKM